MSGGASTPQRGFARLFNPRAIAVIGASPETSRIGGQPIPILLESGYGGGIYPVNPKYPKIGDLACYASVADVPQPCDLAVVAVAARLVPDVIRQCGRAGISFAIVFSAGFREVGAEGVALEAELKAAAAASERSAQNVRMGFKAILSWTMRGKSTRAPNRITSGEATTGSRYSPAKRWNRPIS